MDAARREDLGPRGYELRRLLERFAAENRDPIACAAIPALAGWARWRGAELGPVAKVADRRELRRFRAEVRRLTHDDPGYPNELYLAGGFLFQADGPNALLPAEPIMRGLGKMTRPDPSIRAGRIQRGAASRRAVKLADSLIELARDDGIWVPADDLLSIYTSLIWTAHSLAHAARILDRVSPSAVAVLATTNAGPRSLVFEARGAGIPSVYFPHTAVLMDPALNDLPTDFAGVRGSKEAGYYAEVAGPTDRIEVVGNPSVVEEPMPEHDPALAPVLAPPFSEEESLSEAVEMVHAALGSNVMVSAHPHADAALLERVLPKEWEVWRGRTYELLRRGPPMLIQSTSGVSLEALSLGIPTIELRLPPARTITYPLIREPYVRIATTADELARAAELSRADASSAEARAGLQGWAREWSHPSGEEAGGRGVSLLKRASATDQPPGPIWSAWPAPRI